VKIFSRFEADHRCRFAFPDALPNRVQIQATATDRTCLLVRPAHGTLELCLSHSNYGDQRPLDSALSGPILVANLPFAASYGHVFNDVLPALLAHEANPAFRHVLTAATPLLEGLIALLELRFSRVRLLHDGEELYLDAGAVTVDNHQPYHRRDPALAAALKAEVERTMARLHPRLEARTLLYYSRSGSGDVHHQRAMEPANEAAILELLAAHARAQGLELVIFNGQRDGVTLPLAEQAALFRSARMVVGPHGAGLANLLWLNPQAHCAICEFTSGSQAMIWGRYPFSKNFNTLYGGLIGQFSRYALIPFTPASSVASTAIDLADLREFLAWASQAN
jgi:capsular polysaccharide biosynthesis protein